ncbi:sensor histidine kinase [Cohnella sp. GbtcB17]|uniref:sensor histidine kinase n=1 Tax=Cohnella sp. GbtcB17 TaxID=2824762 RepID=UPI001C30CC18|nr:histidine kinase [Cohnella sp. GbtcB17]
MVREWLNNLRIYPKLVIAFLLVFAPIFIVGLIMNARASDRVREEISTSMENQVDFFLASFQSEVERILTFKTAFVTDKDFERTSAWFGEMSDYERAQSVITVQNKLSMFQRTSPYIKDVGVYFPALGRMLHADDYGPGLSEQELAALKAHPSLEGTPISGFADSLIINQVYPVFAYGTAPVSFALKVELSNERIVSSLNSVTGQGGALMASASGDWRISDPDYRMLIGPVSEYLGRLGPGSGSFGHTLIEQGGTRFWVSYKYSPYINAYLAVYMPERTVIGPLNEYRRWLWGLSLLSLLVVAGFSLGVHRMVHRPVRELVNAFRKVEKGDFAAKVEEGSQFEFRYLSRQFNSMVQRLDVLIRENFEQDIRMKNAELKQLQSQINPHFLYNCFLTLHFLARNDNLDNVIKMTGHLGGYYRGITRNASAEVSMEQEVNHLKDYAAIQAIRFESRIELRIGDLPEECRTLRVPRLILQPLLENAYEHALEPMTNGGLIVVRFETGRQSLKVTIEDNGKQLSIERLDALQRLLSSPPAAHIETTGMINVHRRLQLYFGAAYGLEAQRSHLGGLAITVRLPIEKEE